MQRKTARLAAVGIIVLGAVAGIFDAPMYADRVLARIGVGESGFRFERLFAGFPYRLGLDIQGGTHLVYHADVSVLAESDKAGSMEALRDVIERRVNLFGVAEPLVEVERSGGDWRLVAELAGVRDVGAAIRLIGETPYLEFREERSVAERDAIMAAQKQGERMLEDPNFVPTELTGRFITRADVDFDQTTFQPLVNLKLTGEGATLFAELTKQNIGKQIAIYLDGVAISAPVVREEITGGSAQISGNFTPQSARELAGRLNAGALPVPIKLIAQQSIEASLGRESLARSLYAGAIGFLAVVVFMLLWYRLPGLIAVAALVVYAGIVLAIFKLIPVTLTLAGIAGFVLSVGMAVDANILIFERMKEELARGLALEDAIREGFRRAWTSIRDSNVSSLLTAGILYWLGTSMVQGFALTLGVGILVSMFSAISVTRTLLVAISTPALARMRGLFLSGFSKWEVGRRNYE
ncbi:MAG: protein-export membrane protein SecD [Candidatus Sungbacteria bacterium RIFCSPHIGHO2_02_FULL_52_23]|uniref:Protein translocase subunit SecD n=1 Tax=Candidatus Sungbacteria bacterium RIFCSPHIGHO2_02_FULL_52_23 TaxID=1802274 RepID=A0A1G2KSE4_9BACT|nr:MAG: protein-export membrane protein SecD [Candidatus Sungbacteria bacterium RIFCSPHIGHO2_02_FULL_52_23]